MAARGGRAEHPELPLVHTDRVRLVAEHTAERNRLLRRVSKTVRAALGTETPAHFRVDPEHMADGTEAERRESLLAELAMQCGEHKLVSIELAGFALDPRASDTVSPRGAPRLAAVLRRCERLRLLDVNGCLIVRWTEIADALAFCPRLQHLDASNCDMRGQTHHLARALHSTPALETLSLRGNLLMEVHLRAICAALPQCTRLRELSLAENRLSNGSGALLAAALPLCPRLESVDLSRNMFGDAFAEALAPALPLCRVLRQLDLSRNGLEPGAADALSQGQNWSASLRHLSLQGNRLEAEGLAFFTARGFGGGLTHLNLAGNYIRWPQQAACLAHDLPLMRGLTFLALSENRLGDRFMAALVAELAHCPALEVLDLANTHVSDAGVQGLPLALPQCTRLARLILTGFFNRLSTATTAAIQRAWTETRDPTNTGAHLPRGAGLSLNPGRD